MKYESAFLIRSPKLIINKLAILHKNKCLLNVSFGDPGDTFITTVLEINKQYNEIIFYHGPPKNLLEKLYTSDTITFKTEHLGVKVSFIGKKMKKIRQNDTLVFSMAIPETLFWVEARDFHRVKIPPSKPSFCLITLSAQESAKLTLYDISLTGFSVLNNSEEISKLLNPNLHFQHCKLLLADFDEISMSFEIRHKFIVKREYIRGTEKIGCKFLAMSQGVENIIQRYLLEIERERQQNLLAEYEMRAQHVAATEITSTS